MKSLFKRSPLIIAAVRGVRAFPFLVAKSIIRRVLSWANRSTSRRSLFYETLQDRFVYAEHLNESYFIKTSDEYIGRSLYARGDFDLLKFEKACKLIDDVNALVRSDDSPVLIDIGANVGSVCIPAVKRGLVARAIAIEPDRENFQLLKINVILNEVEDRVDTHLAAVGAKAGSIKLSRSATNSGDHRIAALSCDSSDNVPMIMLDGFADQLNLSNAILWMDIQGYEGFAIRGARRFVAAGVPMVFEFSKQDLIQAGCFDLLLTELSKSPYTVYFDLNDAKPEKCKLTMDALRGLADKLDAQKAFTDLLLLRA